MARTSFGTMTMAAGVVFAMGCDPSVPNPGGEGGAPMGEEDGEASGNDSPTPEDEGSVPGDGGTAGPGQETSEPETPAETTDDAPAETGDASEESGGDEAEPPLPDGNVVRFIAMGDAGEGNDAQYSVGYAIEQVCVQRGCSFVLYLGDNFYDTGVDSVSDEQFTEKFEMPYADVDLPFHIALGNHDYGLLGNQWEKAQYQIDYSAASDKWSLPSTFYRFTEGHVTFVGLDTAALFWNEGTGEQRDFLRDTLATTESDWVIGFGHHPYVSNGAHGNAGNYEGLGIIPIVDGQIIKNFFDDEICGKVAVYFSGHDHNRQWHPRRCGTDFIVSGAASKTTDFDHRDNNPQVYFEDDSREGFAWVEIDENQMTVAFYDLDANLDYERTLTLGE